jgi:hypothetical protein
MPNDERRTVEESYTSATNSSNLRCEADRRTDVDVLIAAGCTPGILGAALMRLHSEWDGCAKPRAMTETDARLLMGNIKTLPRVLTILSDWASLRGLDAPMRLAQAVIAHWLDSTCHACHGRGHEVIPGTPSLGRKCKACHGSGKRKEPKGEAGRQMLNMMDEAVIVARTSMKKRLRQSMDV